MLNLPQDIFLKKKLGQNFLVDKNILEKIVKVSSVNKNDIVFEIGAGVGNLTSLLAKKAKYVFANEFDKKLLKILSENISSFSNVEIVHGDFLKINLALLLDKFYPENKIKIIANIPYNISTKILKKIFANRKYFSECILMLQEEFAKRIVAKEGSKTFGRLSIFTQYYTEPRILFKVKSSSFFPKPEVESCVVCLKIKESTSLEKDTEDLFFKIVEYSFQRRRKKIKSIISSFIKDKDISENILNFCNISCDKRPEDLSSEKYILLAKKLKSLKV